MSNQAAAATGEAGQQPIDTAVGLNSLLHVLHAQVGTRSSPWLRMDQNDSVQGAFASRLSLLQDPSGLWQQACNCQESSSLCCLLVRSARCASALYVL